MRGRATLAFAAVLFAACGNDHGPSRVVSSLSLTVYTTEWEPQRRRIMVLGEAGTIDVGTETLEGCFFEAPCPVSVDVRVSSSNSDVVSLDRQTVHTPATVSLRAHAAGTTTITAKVGNLTKSERVDVVEAPLPLDDVQITLVTNWNDLPAQYDESGSLAWVSLPVGQAGALSIFALRDGTGVIGVPLTVTSSMSSIAVATSGCRPPSMDPDCGVYSDGWVVGVAPGDVQVMVTQRNVTRHFTAHVEP
jgi:hypothetical protein